MEKIIESLLEADKSIQKANHLFYVTFPLLKNKNLLIKVVLEARNAVTNCIVAILHYEYVRKRISLTKNPEANFKTFEESCSARYGLQRKDLDTIKELFDITKIHEDSVMEIMNKNRVVILSKELKHETITPENTKKFIELSKVLFRNIKEKIIREKRGETSEKG